MGCGPLVPSCLKAGRASLRMKPARKEMERTRPDRAILSPWIQLCLKLAPRLDFSAAWADKFSVLLRSL